MLSVIRALLDAPFDRSMSNNFLILSGDVLLQTFKIPRVFNIANRDGFKKDNSHYFNPADAALLFSSFFFCLFFLFAKNTPLHLNQLSFEDSTVDTNSPILPYSPINVTHDLCQPDVTSMNI